MTKIGCCTALMFLFSAPSYGGEAEIIKTKFTNEGGTTWRVDTTLKHGDTGWEHYADGWRVVDTDGKELGKRTLYHPHQQEQPFTRSLNGLTIPKGTSIVYLEAHDKVHGWSKQRIKVDLSKKTGSNFEVVH